MISITGKDNPTLKLIRSLQRKKCRQAQKLYFAEGLRIVREAMMDVPAQIYAVMATEVFLEKEPELLKASETLGAKVYTMPEYLFQGICCTENPQGIGAVLRMPEETMPQREDYILVLDGVSEPGNLGTMIRTAEAAGVDAVWLMQDCVDLYNPKVVRSTMGSLFRVPCETGVTPDRLQYYRDKGYRLIVTALQDSIPLQELKPEGKQILVIGSEAWGVSEPVLAMADVKVRIPMEGKVESLNAAVAAGIVMYQCSRK